MGKIIAFNSKSNLNITRGDFKAFITFIDDPDSDDPEDKEPALIIAPSNSMLHGRKYATIALSCLWKWADNDYLFRESIKISELLGIGSLGVRQLADLINDCIYELCMTEEYDMVKDARHPKEKQNKQELGEVAVYVDGEIIHEGVLH